MFGAKGKTQWTETFCSSWPFSLLLLPFRRCDCRPSPFRTDDLEPTDTGHYEFYILSSGTAKSSTSSGYLPGLSSTTG